jgi:arylsulfatase
MNLCRWVTAVAVLLIGGSLAAAEGRPNIDALAANGLRFTQFYNCGRCCPTRASLLTGLYPHQAGVGRMTNDAKLPGYRGQLNDRCVTIAEVLRSAEYRTAMVGKWHLSNTVEGPDHLKHLNNQLPTKEFTDPRSYPVGRGFEEHFGIVWGVADYYDPFSLVHNTDAITEVPKGFYLTDAIGDHAVEYIDKYGKGPEPLFMYVAFTAPHWPLHAPEEDVKRYEPVYCAGWDAIRTARHERMKQLGVLPPGAEKLGSRHEPAVKWEDNPMRDANARVMATHAAMIERMDSAVGRIVAKLRERQMLDDTLIFVLSDNGASPEEPTEPGFDRPSQTRDGRPVVYGKDAKAKSGAEDSCAAIGPLWASVSNTPLRLWKAEMYEGGICTPLIVHWPAGLETKPGGITHAVGHVIDLMPTCVRAAGAEYPVQVEGNDVWPMEGQSLLPVFRGEQPAAPCEVLAWEHIGARAIRDGDWKLVSRRQGPWSLYDLSHDRAEENDLSAKEPERVKTMQDRWDRWAKTTNVLPAPKAGPALAK